MDLQPLLADLVRRCMLPIPGVTVKIGAIEQRSRFRIADENGYLGIEVGATSARTPTLTTSWHLSPFAHRNGGIWRYTSRRFQSIRTRCLYSGYSIRRVRSCRRGRTSRRNQHSCANRSSRGGRSHLGFYGETVRSTLVPARKGKRSGRQSFGAGTTPSLYDARVLHVVKRGVAAHDQPGVRCTD